MGQDGEHSYEVESGASLKWTFVSIERVFKIDDNIADRAEVFSRFLRSSEAESILKPFDDEGL